MKSSIKTKTHCCPVSHWFTNFQALLVDWTKVKDSSTPSHFVFGGRFVQQLISLVLSNMEQLREFVFRQDNVFSRKGSDVFLMLAAQTTDPSKIANLDTPEAKMEFFRKASEKALKMETARRGVNDLLQKEFDENTKQSDVCQLCKEVLDENVQQDLDLKFDIQMSREFWSDLFPPKKYQKTD